ncbi:MAG: AMP-binding protein [Candidatus Manganitrophus sp.]|nr:AMP-binding protein [Candidatus Manganitrophus sp.]
MVITADGGYAAGEVVTLKDKVDEALKETPGVQRVVVVRRTNTPVQMQAGRDVWWHDLMETASDQCSAEALDAEHPLFILYTSGSTGKPKGVLHTTGGYLLGATITARWIFDLNETDTFWCTADVGWVTGHTYVVYGPLANGATTVMFEGVPTYPTARPVLADHRQAQGEHLLHRADRDPRPDQMGEEWPKRHDLSSLRLLGTVGEPINPEAWMWYHQVIGQGRCPIVDTWWQTETGAIMITPLPGAIPTKPGSATLPFPGIAADVVNREGESVPANVGGYLVIKRPWPSMLRTIWGDPERYKKQLLVRYPGGLLHRRRRAARQRRLLLDHGPHRRRAQRLRPPPGHDGDRIGAGLPSRRRRGRGGRPARRDQGRRRSPPSSPWRPETPRATSSKRRCARTW